MERIDLTKYLINEDKPAGEKPKEYEWEPGWYAGAQLEALRFYLSPTVEMLASFMEDDYQGECFALLKVEEAFILWRDSFGSCSGCDSLEGSNGYEYIKNTLQEGNTRQFNSIEDAKKYVETTDDFFWSDKKETILNELFKGRP